jgi:hypothetical protein
MDVRFPDLREHLRAAAHELRDEDTHDRLWVRGDRQSPGEFGFDDTLMVFIDETETFGPGDLVGNLLIDEREAEALQAVQDAIRALIDLIGERGRFSDAVATGEVWDRCVKAAAQLEVLLNRS